MSGGWQEKLAWPRLIIFMVVFFLLLTTIRTLTAKRDLFGFPKSGRPKGDPEIEAWCPLPDPAPVQDGMTSSTEFQKQDSPFLQQQVDRLTTVVNIPTVSYDDNGDVDEDPRWQPFSQLHDALQNMFPHVYEKMELEKVNKYGLLYTLPGSSQDLKPIILMSHQDVVPVPDPSTWKHPPFDAHFDGQWLWGRGSVDTKNTLIGILSAMERLLEQDFKNSRTIMFSFGFDEETGGFRGAKHLAARIQEKLGVDSVAMIVDEGGLGIQAVDDVAYALPGTAEKGFMDIVLTLKTPGGHSSAPPPNSGIGIMARLVAALEDRPLLPHLDENNPFRDYLKCEVKYSPHTVEPWLRKSLLKGQDITAKLLESRGEQTRWLMQTSQSVDIMVGGIKDNQVPETTQTTINYRVLPTEDMDAILKDVADLLAPIANKYNIAVAGPGYSQIDRGSGVLTLNSTSVLPPSPLTPSGPDNGSWNVFASSIRQVFESQSQLPSATKVVPVGTLMIGNTDTAHYWNLTRNIYRFTPRWEGTGEAAHTVDERVDMRAHVGGVRFYYELIRNMDKHSVN